MAECKHEKFAVQVAVNRITDLGKFIAELKVHCSDCGLPFMFLGLRAGLDYEGVAVSADGKEARLAIAPAGSASLPTGLNGGVRH